MQIREKIEKWAKEALEGGSFQLVHPKELRNGDFTLIVSENEAENIFGKLEKSRIDEIERLELIKPRFVNIYLSAKFFEDSINEINEKADKFGQTNLLEGQKIFIEHTQPNPFKEFHIGHLMNNAIGESIFRILKVNDAEVRTASYHGDVGLHVAKWVWGIQKGFDYEKAYAYGSKVFEEDENAKQEIINLNKDIYKGEVSKVCKICKEGFQKFKSEFEIICKKLDSTFNYQFWESTSGDIGKKIVMDHVEDGIFEKSEGAVVFKGENFEPKTHIRVFLTKDGLPTYEAKEVGLAKMKKDMFPYDRSITVTANEQDGFFKVVEVAIGEIFPELKGKLKHLSHGMLKLPTGKMSSRTGNIITAEGLIGEAKEKILEKVKDREFSDVERSEISEIVAIGAIKYSILRQAIGGDIVFDFDKSLSFEGDSGPYLQYTYVRAKSVLEKALSTKLLALSSIPQNWETTEVEKLLYRFPEIIGRAGREYAPHHIVTYLIELASSFNSFYAKEKIVDESDLASPYKVALTEALSHVLKNGLYLLGIKVPKKM